MDFKTGAWLIPFAQSKMVKAFMDGIDPVYEDQMDQLMLYTIKHYPEVILDNIKGLNKKQKEEIKRKVTKIGIDKFNENKIRQHRFKQENYSNPILQVVAFLPKNELAAMAEALVNLTCFKKKISMEDETVGGPIDVAVISKGDGLIWIKRKHYFVPELNAQFFSNYYYNIAKNKK